MLGKAAAALLPLDPWRNAQSLCRDQPCEACARAVEKSKMQSLPARLGSKVLQ